MREDFKAADSFVDPTRKLRLSFGAPVWKLVSDQARSSPHSVAICDDLGQWTYGELDAASNLVAHQLRSLGVEGGQFVAIWGRRSSWLVTAIIGVLKSEAAFCVLDPSHPQARILRQLRMLEPSVLLSPEGEKPPESVELELCSHGGRILALPSTAQGLKSLLRGHILWATSDVSTNAQDAAYVLFTSGTTGLPKAIVTPHHALPHFLRWYTRRFDFSSNDRMAMLSGLSHDPLLRDVFTPLSIGATLHIPPQEFMREPALLNPWLRERQITVCHWTPSFCKMLCGGQLNYLTLPDLRYAFFGGETLHSNHIAAFRNLAPRAQAVNCYGTSETPQIMAFHIVRETGEPDLIPFNTGIDDVQLLVLDSKNRLCTENETGEICVRTPYLSSGYLGDPEQTRQCFVPNPFGSHSVDSPDLLYRTGDLGVYGGDGLVHYVGRADRQMKIRGFRVELDEIEVTLQGAPAVRHAVVLRRQTESGDRIAAFVEPEPAYRLDTVKAYLQDSLPDYMTPSEYHEVDRFPLTANGKVDYAALAGECGRASSQCIILGRTDTEKMLVGIWEAVLGTTVGVTDDFFEMGGDSLIAVEILIRVENAFKRRLPLSTFFDAPTIQDLAAIIDGDAVAVDAVHITCLKATGSKIPVFWIPGGAGVSTIAFRQISSLIGIDRAVYGLEASIEQSHTPIDLHVKARSYVEALQAQWPTGPYYLFGFSAGSWLAYEMAVQLEALGQQIVLVVFDMAVPGYPGFIGKIGTALEVLRFHGKRLRGLPVSSWVPFTKRIIQQKSQRMREESVMKNWNGAEDGMDLFTVAEYRNWRASDAYRNSKLSRFSGDLRVVLASDSIYDGLARSLDPRLGWSKLARGRLDVYRVPGNHSSMLQEPNVKALASTLKLVLNEVDNRCTSTAKQLSLHIERRGPSLAEPAS